MLSSLEQSPYHYIYPSGEAAETLMTLASPQVLQNMSAEKQAMILAPIMFPPQWLEEHPEILNTVIHLTPVRSATPEIIQQQGLAVGTWKGSCDRLASITQPPLLIVGDQDILVPAANSIMMAREYLIRGWLLWRERGMAQCRKSLKNSVPTYRISLRPPTSSKQKRSRKQLWTSPSEHYCPSSFYRVMLYLLNRSTL